MQSNPLTNWLTTEQIVTCAPLQVAPDISVLDAIALMSEGQDTSCVLIVDRMQLMGILTERDLVRLTASRIDLSRTEIAQVMSHPVISLTLAEAQNLFTALSIMRSSRIRHLPVVDESGQLVGLVTQDQLYQIEERRHRKIAFEQRQNQWQALFENALDAIAIADDEGRYVDANSAACALFGVSREELLHSSIADFAAPDVDVTQMWQQFLQQGQMSGEFRLYRRDGIVRDTEFAATANFIPHHHLAILRDISDRKRAEAEREQAQMLLQQQEQAYKALVENSPDIIERFDIHLRHLYVSPVLKALTGISVEQFLGKTSRELGLPESMVNLWETGARALLATGQTQTIEFETPTVEGMRCFEMRIAPELTKAGTIESILCISRDITERKQSELALLELTTALENAVEGISRLDTQGYYLSVNQAYANAVGYSPTEMIGMAWQVTVHPEDLAKVEAAYQQMLLNGKVECEARGVRKDGSLFYKKLVMITAYDEQENFTGHYCFMKDISEQQAALRERKSERKQAEEALQQSERKFRAIFDSTFQFIGLLNPEGIVVEANQTALDAIAAERADVTEQPFWATPWWAHSPQLQKQLQQAIISAASGEFVRFEAEHLLADGTSVFVDFSLKPVFDGEGKVTMLIPEGRDISDRKLAEQTIREQAALIDIATDAISVRDLENCIVFWSQGAERLYGWTSEEVLRKKAQELFPKESPPQLEASLKATLKQGFWQGELEQVTKTGQPLIVASRWTLLRDESGQPKSILVVNSDITEKKQLEMQFYRAQRLESIGTLASGIAHDFNNLLTPILAVAQLLLLKLSVDEQTRQLLVMLEDSAKRGANLVKQVLSFSRGTEGKRITLQVGHLLWEVVSIAKRTFPKSIEIFTEIPTIELWSISADATQIHQVLMNLIINARDAMPNGGILTISAANRYLDQNYARMNLEAQVNSYVAISVSDTGTGIPPELLERIFDPFFTTKEVGAGTGLGLATVLGIVKNHGGFVKVYSEVGKGTQFQIFLPASEEKLSQITLEEKLPRGNGELILIVDDEATIRQITKTSLENYNYRTLLASDGIETLSLYAQYQKEIAVVLIDLMMPNLDGLTAIRALQKMNPQVKAIASSGLSANSQLAFSADVKTFLLKPYTLKELLNALHDLILTTDSATD